MQCKWKGAASMTHHSARYIKFTFIPRWNDYHLHSNRRLYTEKSINDSASLWFTPLRLLLSGPWTGSEPLCWSQRVQTMEIPFSQQHNPDQCATHEADTVLNRPGYYKPSSNGHSRWTRRVQMTVSVTPWKNSTSSAHSIFGFFHIHRPNGTECRNLTQDMFYSSKETSKHGK